MGVGRGLRVEVEVLDDERTSTPAIFKGPRVACHPTCCCSVSLDRCGRCDLLVDLEDFHLMSVARTLQALVLDVESCNQLVGCPGCGVIAHGHGRVVVDRRALGLGSGADPVVQTTLYMPRTHLRNGDIPGAQRQGVRTHQRTRQTPCTNKTGI